MSDKCEKCGGELLLCPEPHYWVCTKCEHMSGYDPEEREEHFVAKRLRMMLHDFAVYFTHSLEADNITKHSVTIKINEEYVNRKTETFIDRHFPFRFGSRNEK